jgi:hypothetical protein
MKKYTKVLWVKFFLCLFALNVYSQEIPTMTSNTSPSGIASASSSYSSTYYPWKAFDGEDESGSASRWISKVSGTYSSQWISYQFPSSVIIKGYSLIPETGGCIDRSPNTWYFQGWNGSSWQTLDYRTGYTIADWQANFDRQFKIKNPKNYTKYRLYVTKTNGAVVVSIRRLRMHGSLPVNKIPTMTSNTSPSGVASATSSYSSTYYPWKAFDGEDESGSGSRWISKSSGAYSSQWISYQFVSQVTVRAYSLMPETGGCIDRSPNTWYFQGWDGSSWQTLDYRSGYTIADWQADYDRQFTIKNPKNYSKYRLYVTKTNGSVVVSIRRLRMHCFSEGYIPANKIPTMTSNTSPSGVASATSSYSSTYYPWKAFDGEDESGSGSRWISKVSGTYSSQWISYQFTSSVKIEGYSIMPETGGCIDRSPNTWYFQGWNGSSWQTLDYRTGYTIADWNADYDRQFIIKNPKSFSKYRLYVTKTNGSAVVSIRRLRMHGSSDDMLKSTEEIIPIALDQENEIHKNNANLTLYPNPNHGNFTIELNNNLNSNDRAETTIQIVNLNGQVVYSANTINNSFELQLDNLCKGLYFLRTIQKDIINTKRFIIE